MSIKTASGAVLEGNDYKSFAILWNAFDLPLAIAKGAEAWRLYLVQRRAKLPPNQVWAEFNDILAGAQKEAAARESRARTGLACVYFATFIRERRWEDYLPLAVPGQKPAPQLPRQLSPGERERALATMRKLDAEFRRKNGLPPRIHNLEKETARPDVNTLSRCGKSQGAAIRADATQLLAAVREAGAGEHRNETQADARRGAANTGAGAQVAGGMAGVASSNGASKSASANNGTGATTLPAPPAGSLQKSPAGAFQHSVAGSLPQSGGADREARRAAAIAEAQANARAWAQTQAGGLSIAGIARMARQRLTSMNASELDSNKAAATQLAGRAVGDAGMLIMDLACRCETQGDLYRRADSGGPEAGADCNGAAGNAGACDCAVNAGYAHNEASGADLVCDVAACAGAAYARRANLDAANIDGAGATRHCAGVDCLCAANDLADANPEYAGASNVGANAEAANAGAVNAGAANAGAANAGNTDAGQAHTDKSNAGAVQAGSAVQAGALAETDKFITGMARRAGHIAAAAEGAAALPGAGIDAGNNVVNGADATGIADKGTAPEAGRARAGNVTQAWQAVPRGASGRYRKAGARLGRWRGRVADAAMRQPETGGQHDGGGQKLNMDRQCGNAGARQDYAGHPDAERRRHVVVRLLAAYGNASGSAFVARAHKDSKSCMRQSLIQDAAPPRDMWPKRDMSPQTMLPPQGMWPKRDALLAQGMLHGAEAGAPRHAGDAASRNEIVAVIADLRKVLSAGLEMLAQVLVAPGKDMAVALAEIRTDVSANAETSTDVSAGNGLDPARIRKGKARAAAAKETPAKTCAEVRKEKAGDAGGNRKGAAPKEKAEDAGGKAAPPARQAAASCAIGQGAAASMGAGHIQTQAGPAAEPGKRVRRKASAGAGAVVRMQGWLLAVTGEEAAQRAGKMAAAPGARRVDGKADDRKETRAGARAAAQANAPASKRAAIRKEMQAAASCAIDQGAAASMGAGHIQTQAGPAAEPGKRVRRKASAEAGAVVRMQGWLLAGTGEEAAQRAGKMAAAPGARRVDGKADDRKETRAGARAAAQANAPASKRAAVRKEMQAAPARKEMQGTPARKETRAAAPKERRPRPGGNGAAAKGNQRRAAHADIIQAQGWLLPVGAACPAPAPQETPRMLAAPQETPRQHKAPGAGAATGLDAVARPAVLKQKRVMEAQTDTRLPFRKSLPPRPAPGMDAAGRQPGAQMPAAAISPAAPALGKPGTYAPQSRAIAPLAQEDRKHESLYASSLFRAHAPNMARGEAIAACAPVPRGSAAGAWPCPPHASIMIYINKQYGRYINSYLTTCGFFFSLSFLKLKLKEIEKRILRTTLLVYARRRTRARYKVAQGAGLPWPATARPRVCNPAVSRARARPPPSRPPPVWRNDNVIQNQIARSLI